jgi:hypothetical protein
MPTPFFGGGSDSDSSDNDPDVPQQPVSVSVSVSALNLSSSSDDEVTEPGCNLPGSSTFSFDEPNKPRRLPRQIIREPRPAVNMEPVKSEEELTELMNLPLPPGFVIPLISSPDVSFLAQGILQQFAIVNLLQRLS